MLQLMPPQRGYAIISYDEMPLIEHPVRRHRRVIEYCRVKTNKLNFEYEMTNLLRLGLIATSNDQQLLQACREYFRNHGPRFRDDYLVITTGFGSDFMHCCVPPARWQLVRHASIDLSDPL